MRGLMMRAGLAAVLAAGVCGWSGTAEAQACGAISPNACSTVPVVSDPAFSRSFDAPSGGLADTGFTMVQSHSNNRYSTTPSVPGTPGYEPSLLSVSGGRLLVTSTRGSFFQTTAQNTANNSQVNALGVGIGSGGAYTETVLTVDVVSPPFADTANGEQAGLWFGLGEDDYVRLSVNNRTGVGAGVIELRREVGGASTGGAVDASSANVIDVNTSTIRLTLTLNRTTNQVTGAYSSSSGESGVLGPLTVPASFVSGQVLADGVTGPVSFGGLFTTSRFNTTTPAIPFAFDNFSAASLPAAPPPPIPTLTEWAMILLTGLLALTGATLIRRRYAVANG